MAQIFPRWSNKLPLAAALAGTIGPAVVVAGVWYFFSPWYTDVGYRPVQPVPYSHRLHVGELGLDCRYCHASVERSAVANLPPTQTCMNCHQLVKRDSAALSRIGASASLSFFTRAWQFMQVRVGGTFATGEISTEA